MAILSRDALLTASDIQEKTISLPSLGPDAQVKIRSLPAEYANAAVSQAIRMEHDGRGGQVATMDNGKLELLQVLHGLVEPKLESIAAVQTFAKNCGPAFKTVVREIVELSNLSEEAVSQTVATFPVGGTSPAGGDVGADSPNGSGGSDLHVRAG